MIFEDWTMIIVNLSVVETSHEDLGNSILFALFLSFHRVEKQTWKSIIIRRKLLNMLVSTYKQ
jgi:hypothetical protein